jgi:hypothetical protein
MPQSLLCSCTTRFSVDLAAMAKTHEIFTKPVDGTKVAPIHEYDDEQKGKLKASREVSGSSL